MDLEAFEERAAILEYDEGMTRFQAETEAARRQGYKRHEVINEIRERDSKRGRDIGQQALRDSTSDLPAMQPHTAKQDGSMLERNLRSGRDTGEMLALRMDVRKGIR